MPPRFTALRWRSGIARVPEGWADHAFDGMNGIRLTARPMPQASCYHSVHLTVLMRRVKLNPP